MKTNYTKSLYIALLMCGAFTSRAQIITTIAGDGANGFFGDGGPATNAELWAIHGVAVDASGNVYIADNNNNRIRKVNTSGIISTIAGNGAGSYTGDGGQATAAELANPSNVAVDGSGNIYITDGYNQVIRKVNKSGIISTVAGNGYMIGQFQGSYSGDGGPATAAELNNPDGVSIDASGNIYIADESNSRVRKVNTSGTISTFAGNGAFGYSGDGSQATAAELNIPSYVATDVTGNIYISDWGNSRIRMVNTSGIITTIAGDSATGYSGDGGNANDAEINHPMGLVLDAAGYVCFSDEYNQRVRKLGPKPAGINELTSSLDEIIVYPVPNTGLFSVTGITKGQVIELFNYMGELINNTVANNSTIHFDISSKANGIYLIRILNKDGSVAAQSKIVKTE